jgi:glyoxylase-like metal-dependent hydrolase (beta-lactamase superfamily II)
MKKLTVGKLDIYPLMELEAGELIQSIIKNASQENLKQMMWLQPEFVDADGNAKAVVQCFLIHDENDWILIDACNGNNKERRDMSAWSHLKTDFLGQLHNIGITQKDVTIVVCTHLHTDHVGWLTHYQDSWMPTFPNAKHIIVKEEFDYWKTKPDIEIDDDKDAFDDSVMPVVNAGLASFVDKEYSVNSHLKLVPTPGHTPSHVCVLINSEGNVAIIGGDLFHHPCQITYPNWSSEGVFSKEQEINSRGIIIEKITDKNILFMGSHFTCAGYAHKTPQGGIRFSAKE